jgi:enoyl-CoA hydratase/carnithine racemase
MTSFETLLYEETDGVAWVTLNRPRRNKAVRRDNAVAPAGTSDANVR